MTEASRDATCRIQAELHRRASGGGVNMYARSRVPLLAIIAIILTVAQLPAQGGIVGRAKAKAQDKLQHKADSTVDTLTGKAVDKATGAKGAKASSSDSARTTAATKDGAGQATATAAPAADAPAAYKVYQ